MRTWLLALALAFAVIPQAAFANDAKIVRLREAKKAPAKKAPVKKKAAPKKHAAKRAVKKAPVRKKSVAKPKSSKAKPAADTSTTTKPRPMP